MCLEDDGIGYDSSQVEKQGGLKNITERAQRINAKLNIQSVPERGTKVVINFKNTKTLEYGIAI
jgi:signal transduction histidine kinase